MSGLNAVMAASVTLPLGFGLYTIATERTRYLDTFILTIITGVLSYFATDRLIPIVKEFTRKAGLCGKDINKRGTPAGEKDIPESLGIVPGTIFILMNMIALAYTKFYFSGDLFIEHLSALLSICFCVFLGFSDDVMDLRWRYKLILPTIASIPLLLAYQGITKIVVPIPFRPFLGESIDIHFLYYIYMGSLAVFCTNAINIYAGINGLEVGQSIIIGCSIALHNVIEIYLFGSQVHMFSLMIIVPFIFCSLALLKYNRYPSMVFVGDTYCYFAGMTFAVVGILAHFSKTLLLFFIPQILNFLFSLPQLIGLVPCARHRLPKFDKESGKVVGQAEHWNLLNVFLRIVGPQTEKATCTQLMIFQVFCCGIAFIIRYVISRLFF